MLDYVSWKVASNSALVIRLLIETQLLSREKRICTKSSLSVVGEEVCFCFKKMSSAAHFFRFRPFRKGKDTFALSMFVREAERA